VVTEHGLTLLPTTTFADCPPLDLLLVPGGPGIDTLLEPAVLDWIAARGAAARFVTSVCTGALVLGAAGLLDGYRATTHWLSMDLLPLVGAEPVEARVVVDRNRITAGGVTAGLDFALAIAAALGGQGVAEGIQLLLEYDPAPPFGAGSPRTAAPSLVAGIREARAPLQAARAERLCALLRRDG
jgi:cyclohexyl-isocyanide hydratase